MVLFSENFSCLILFEIQSTQYDHIDSAWISPLCTIQKITPGKKEYRSHLIFLFSISSHNLTLFTNACKQFFDPFSTALIVCHRTKSLVPKTLSWPKKEIPLKDFYWEWHDICNCSFPSRIYTQVAVTDIDTVNTSKIRINAQ